MILRIKQFVKKASSRAEELGESVPQDFIQKIKSLSSNEIVGYLNTFTPLDVIALIAKHNKKSFDEAITTIVAKTIKSNRGWLEELGIQDEGSAVAEAMNFIKDPNNGILAEILQYGSLSDRFNLSSDPKDNANLKGSQKSTKDNNIIIPFCPYDKSFGEDHPLWSIDEEGDIVEGFDENNRCLNYNIIGEMTQEEFNELKALLFSDMKAAAIKYKISPTLLEGLVQNKKDLEYQDGVAFLRCTYSPPPIKRGEKKGLPGKFPTLAGALFMQIKGHLSSMLSKARRKSGKSLTPKELERLRILTNQEKTNKITDEEKVEFEKLKSRITKNPIYTEISEHQVSSDGETRSLYDKGDSDSSEEQDIHNSLIQLTKEMSKEDLKLIIQHGAKLASFLKLMQDIPDSKPSEKDGLKSQAEKLLSKAVRSESKSQCNTCGEVLKEEGEACPQAGKMRSSLLQIFPKVNTFSEFNVQTKSLSEKEAAHYEKSGIEPFFSEALGNHSVSENDVDFELSPESMKVFNPSGESSDTSSSRQDFEKTVSNALRNFSEKQKRAYFGKDIKSFQSEAENQKVNKIFNIVSKITNHPDLKKRKEITLDLQLILENAYLWTGESNNKDRKPEEKPDRRPR